MTDEPLSPIIIGMLKDLEKVFKQHDVDFYIVGAVARDIHLSAIPGKAAFRATKDVDLAILLASEEQFYAVKQSMLATGTFEAHPTEPIKIFYKKSIEVDLLPFGAIENNSSETILNKPKVFVLDVPGFQEAYSSITTIDIDGTNINVCAIEGIVLLKLIAFDDRPSRTKDISDIDHIIMVYFELYDTAVFNDSFDVMELYDTNESNYLSLVSARVIGRKMSNLLLHSPSLKNRVEGILTKRPIDTWQAMLSGLLD
ncbi:nucleotidyl transferase AbiEii/AbiGii toxin family protein [Flavihumibacter profundi]|uniref:nucleotidyl transferase AbiEii/AbiGii toxin family protein n=1 Tax=Flavihumibacter profundi TaxID=2716883 RepID=UPI001CC40A78|nr:nucleotidyl transferase AbiEii/AbiGii toxin family protein [Flavihumibacter profundi]MBZ5857536.1 nucleotidyl transferase AbiEii/AbiGii toxin family protein [Flavihumibacter profundi]